MTRSEKVAATYAVVWKEAPENERAELRAFADFYASYLPLRRFFASPSTSYEQKREAIVQGLKGQACAKTIDRLLFLERQGQLNLIPEIVTHMERRKRAFLVSAEPLAPHKSEQILKHFEQLTGLSLKLEQRTDPDLIGGFKIRIGSKVYDSTIKNSLKLLKQQLGKAPCH